MRTPEGMHLLNEGKGMTMRFVRNVFVLFFFAAAVLPSPLAAQVTTATLYGVVHDATGAVMPGTSVTATNQGTNQSRDIVTDERGEFALPALPAGRYTLKIELPGFKTYINQGLELGAGRTVRQTFVLEVGQVAENITVAETAPLVATASAAQQTSLGTQQVTELPLARRNVTSMLSLAAPGLNQADGGGREIRLNGVGAGGIGITVDGTDATANPEIRGLGQYGGNNQIDVMSIEAVAEVQVAKGILPAEYGGVAGGQVNMLMRSGTNAYHGSAFWNNQNEYFFARDPFLSAATPKPDVKFNQFGGSLGGPIIKNRAMFFTTFEGYRETTGVSLLGTVPTQPVRDQILAALPYPETKIVLDKLPLPNEPVNAQIGRYRTVKNRTRRDNHVLAKGDVVVLGGNLAVSYNRMRPYSVSPSFHNWPVAQDSLYAPKELGNAVIYPSTADRIAAQYVLARGGWVSETRFGWNRNNLTRTSSFWSITDPNRPAPKAEEIQDVSKRLSFLTVTGLFGTPLSEYFPMLSRTENFDQKFSRVMGAHNVKVGFRWFRQGGMKSDPTELSYVYNSLPDLLANKVNFTLLSYGQPNHNGALDEYGAFVQDDWRVNKKLVLNLGLRYDAYPTIKIWPVGERDALMLNLEKPTDLRKMDFGAERPRDKPYDPNYVNFGPRVGFAWTLDDKAKTVVRGGAGILYTAHVYMWLDFSVSDPNNPLEVQWNNVEVAARGVKWPMYSDELFRIMQKDAAGKKIIFALNDTHLPNPYTIQSMLSVQREFGGGWMAEVGWVHTNGEQFPLSRKMAKAFDRETGARPNPALGAASGYYKSSEQRMLYNGLQVSARKRFSNNLGTEFNYTREWGWAQQGGVLTSDFVNGDIGQQQDFFDVFNPNDRGPLANQARQRLTGDVIYSLPWLKDGRGVLSQVLGGWQLSSIIQARAGLPMRLSQPSGINNSRPDYIPGVNPVLPNWGETLLYLNRAAFTPVPTYPITGATIRPGTQNGRDLVGPKRWTVDMSISKSFRLKESVKLALKADFFNALNHVNYSGPNTSINSPEFGKITSASTPRTGQVGVRLTF